MYNELAILAIILVMVIGSIMIIKEIEDGKK